MSAQDNLSTHQFRLFHGTDAEIPVGDFVDPRYAKGYEEDDPDYKVAHATTSIGYAATHGKNVYEVHPPADDEEPWSPEHYVSADGFMVKRKLSPQAVKRLSK